MMRFVDTIALSGRTDITDPCYDKDVWCRTAVNTVPGRYSCYADNDNGLVRGIMIIHEKHEREIKENHADWKEFDTIGVDAGLAGFFDNKPDYTDPEWDLFCRKVSEEEDRTRGTDAHNLHAWGNCFFSTSGYGDGGYPVYGLCGDDGVYYALRIDFID